MPYTVTIVIDDLDIIEFLTIPFIVRLNYYLIVIIVAVTGDILGDNFNLFTLINKCLYR